MRKTFNQKNVFVKIKRFEMISNIKFSNLLGTVYSSGNLVFSSDGNKLLSPVGNRVTCFDLINNKNFTFDYQHRKNISRLALIKNQTLLISVDEDGKAIILNFFNKNVLFHFSFESEVSCLEFSPNGKFIAVACGRKIQVWNTPDITDDQRMPLKCHHIHARNSGDIKSIVWSKDSRFFISSFEDSTLRIFSVSKDDEEIAVTLTGHKDSVILGFFDETQEIIYTLSQDGSLFRWEYCKVENEKKFEEKKETNYNWKIMKKYYFKHDSKISCASYNLKLNIIVVCFVNGEFNIYDLFDFSLIQQMSIGLNKIDSVIFNNSGEWIALGSSVLGQLVVYEWQSESYILKQQGHFDSIDSISYSSDGSKIATASRDGKIKIWEVGSGFCTKTFTDHLSAVSNVMFSKNGNTLFSSSFDGTVRAWDLIRYRNFRTFTANERVQFNTLSVDYSGEIVVASCKNNFEIYIWSVQSGKLLDTLSGHEGPISSLQFVDGKSLLVSASWDKTVRVWNIFSKISIRDIIEVNSEILDLTINSNSNQVSASTFDGHIYTFDLETSNQLHLIDVKKDIVLGRYWDDRFILKNSSRGKFFTTLDYSFDGTVTVAAGSNNSICIYDMENEVLIKKFSCSKNTLLQGTQEFLNSKDITDAGVSIQKLKQDNNSNFESKSSYSLPGTKKKKIQKNQFMEVKINSIKFSPVSHSFAAASTEGLLIYSIDEKITFTPIDLDIEITTQNVLKTLDDRNFLHSLIMSFVLDDFNLTQKVYESIPLNDIKFVCNEFPFNYLEKFLTFIGVLLSKHENHNFEFNLIWIKNLFLAHAQNLRDNKHTFSSALKLIQSFLNKTGKDVLMLSKKNLFQVTYLIN